MKIAKIIDSENFVINEGRIHDIKIGDKIVIYFLGEHIFDPESGRDLGELEIPKLHCNVTHVQETMSIIRSDYAKPRGGSGLATIANLYALGISPGDNSPYNFLSSEERKIKIGDLARKMDRE